MKQRTFGGFPTRILLEQKLAVGNDGLGVRGLVTHGALIDVRQRSLQQHSFRSLCHWSDASKYTVE